MKAIWKNKVLAESDETIIVENNHYFPRSSINKDFFNDSDMHTKCPWKGTASYYNLEIDGNQLEDAAWYYPEPKDGVSQIKGYIAFWKDVEIVE